MPHCRIWLGAAMVLLWLAAPVTAARAQEGFMGGFIVAEPLVPATDDAVRALLPDEGAYNYVSPEGAFMAGPARLTWRPGDDAYAFYYFESQDPADMLYRPAMLVDRVVLWQSAQAIEVGDGRFHGIFVTYHFDGMTVPLYFAVEALAPLLAEYNVALLPAPDTLGTANAQGLWLLQGRPEDILAVLVEAADDEGATTFDMMLLPVLE